MEERMERISVKNSKRRVFRNVLVGFVLTLMIAVSGMPVLPSAVSMDAMITAYAATKKPALNKTSIRIAVGESFNLKVTGTYKKLSWSVNRKSIATVSTKGVVKGVKEGTTTVFATVDGKKIACTVSVENPSLNKTSYSGLVGGSFTLKVNGTKRTISYKSDNTQVAKVSSKGKVTFVKPGTTKIYATMGNKTLSCKVTVSNNTENAVKTGQTAGLTGKEAKIAAVAKEIYDDIAKDNLTNIEIIKRVHDWIVENTEYDYPRLNTNTLVDSDYSPEGVLLNHIAVCQGYAETMALFLDAFGIENKLMVGYGTLNGRISHAWNLVKMEDGWYHLDVTWDDPLNEYNKDTGMIFYNYFMVNDAVMKKDHEWKTADYPAANGKKYLTYIKEVMESEYGDQGILVENQDDYNRKIAEAVKNGERVITLMVKKGFIPDLNKLIDYLFNKGLASSISVGASYMDIGEFIEYTTSLTIK